MKTTKKIISSFLIAVALLFTFQSNANAATYPDASIRSYAEYGTFTVNSGSLIVRAYPGYLEPTIATYGPGESFNYDSIYNFIDSNHNYIHHYASYISYSGERRYVPYGETRNGTFTRYADYTVR